MHKKIKSPLLKGFLRLVFDIHRETMLFFFICYLSAMHEKLTNEVTRARKNISL